MFLLNSRLGLFTAALPNGRAPLLPKLRGHFAEFLNESSPARLRVLHAPTCVGFRYGHLRLARGFSRQCERRDFGTVLPSPSQLTLPGVRISLHPTLAAWTAPSIRPLPSSSCVTPSLKRLRWYRNVNLFSFGYAFRPRLRSRLTLGGRAFPRNPWAFGGGDSHPSFRYSYRHSHFHALHQAFRLSFPAHGTLPYHVAIPSFGVRFSPVPFSAQRHSTSELLRTLSMMAASKPTSWLSSQRHIVPHSTGTSGP